MSKIPKYVLEAIRRRNDAAMRFLKEDKIIGNWGDREGLRLQYVCCHVLTLCEPNIAEKITIEDIEENLRERDILKKD